MKDTDFSNRFLLKTQYIQNHVIMQSSENEVFILFLCIRLWNLM